MVVVKVDHIESSPFNINVIIVHSVPVIEFHRVQGLSFQLIRGVMVSFIVSFVVKVIVKVDHVKSSPFNIDIVIIHGEPIINLYNVHGFGFHVTFRVQVKVMVEVNAAQMPPF